MNVIGLFFGYKFLSRSTGIWFSWLRWTWLGGWGGGEATCAISYAGLNPLLDLTQLSLLLEHNREED